MCPPSSRRKSLRVRRRARKPTQSPASSRIQKYDDFTRPSSGGTRSFPSVSRKEIQAS